MIEKRSFPRLPRDWEIEYRVSKSKSVQPILIKGGMRDLGAGGFSFRSELACPPEALIQFTIKPTDYFKPIIGVARTSWTRGQEGFYESGAQFVWISWKGLDARTAIARYVLDKMHTSTSES